MKIRETHRVIVMGGGGVGKTCLVTQFMEGFFASAYKPTVEDYYRHTVKTPDGRIHTVEIVDTSGTHVFPAMRELSVRSGKAFILVFSVDNMVSFKEAINLWDLIVKIRGENSFPMVLVGNKSDLPRQVTLEHVIQSKAEFMNNCPYIETSAKFNTNVIKLFIELLQQANKLVDGPATPEMSKRRKLSRRLSSFSSLPNITLIRRKSSTNSKNGSPSTTHRSFHETLVNKVSSSSTTSTSSAASITCSSTKTKMFSNFPGAHGLSSLINGHSSHSSPSHSGSKSRHKLASSSSTASSASNVAAAGVKGMEELISNNLSSMNCLVDEGMAGIRRAVINGIDTISLTDGTSPPADPKCAIL